MMSTRFCQWTVFLAILSIPFLIWASLNLETNTDDVTIWLPDSTPERVAYARFVRMFGNDSEIILSWDECRPDDPRLIEFVHRLHESNRSNNWFESIISGDSLIRNLAARKFAFNEPTLKKNFSGILFSEKDDTIAIVARLSDQGRQNGIACVNEIIRQADQTAGLSASDLKMGGDVFTTSQIDDATNHSLIFAFPAALLAVLISWCCLRNIWLVMITLFVAGYAALAGVGLIAVFGFKMNGMLVITPILILVLSLSTTIHFCSYYLGALQQQHPDPVKRMLELGQHPSLMAIVTTAIGVAMLSTSYVPAVRIFAICSSAGLFLSLASVLVIFPALLKLWPPAICWERRCTRVGLESHWPASGRRWASPVTATSFAFIPFLLVGISGLNTTLDPENMFEADHIVNQNREWLANHFSSTNAIDVVVTFPDKSSEPDLLGQIRSVKTIQDELSRIPAVVSTFSAASVCRLPKPGIRSAKTILQESVFNDAILAESDSFSRNRLMAREPGTVSWRIRAGLQCSGADYAMVRTQIEKSCTQVSGKLANTPETWTSGIWMMTCAGRCQILRDLATSFILAFIAITPVVMLLLRGIIVGLLAMVPNVLPALFFFGTLGWMNVEVDIGTLLTASVGLGIAVDDTLHFLHTFRRELQTQDRFSATWSTIRKCWRPMLFTSLICASGLALFAMSSFVPARQFSIAIVVLLASAAICDLVVLPGLILSPLGRFFEYPEESESINSLPTDEDMSATSTRPTFNPLVGYHRRTS